jgi:protein involved in polysaccharide export with SLBB domain
LITLRLAALALGVAASVSLHAAPAITVEVIGSVRNPGMLTLPATSRLSDAALAGAPDDRSYMLGAALLKRSELVAQTRLKTGLLFDLAAIESRQSSDPEGAAAATRIAREVSAMPVTGRIRQGLAPRVLEMDFSANRPLADGDRLYYPTRPSTVTVVGTVEHPCSIPHHPFQRPFDYVRQCPALLAASKDDVFVIQPDGEVQKIGVALWNRSGESTLAPGALIFVPLNARTTRDVNPDFNEDAARFLATQVLDAPGAPK